MSENKENLAYLPSERESLSGYSRRVRACLSQYEGYLQNHIKWYTHYGPGPCPICDLLNMSRYLCDIVNDIVNEVNKYEFEAERAKGSYDNTNFEFKPKVKRKKVG